MVLAKDRGESEMVSGLSFALSSSRISSSVPSLTLPRSCFEPDSASAGSPVGGEAGVSFESRRKLSASRSSNSSFCRASNSLCASLVRPGEAVAGFNAFDRIEDLEDIDAD